MKRWNGWGEENINYPLSRSAVQYLNQRLGMGRRILDSSLESVLATVPASKLPPHPLVQTGSFERLSHARGQSLPDWIALRSGRIGAFPNGVAYPVSNLEIRELFRYARQNGVRIIPYGGGTSVVGHINPLAANEPILTIDLSRINDLIEFNPVDRLAVFGAGIKGPELDRNLNELGYTLGHYPQSFEYSTLGGWIATRSSGQQSYFYGRIEDLFRGGHIETPIGTMEIPVLPASAAGPDLRHLVLGSEGRFGILTQAAVRIKPLSEIEQFYGIFFPSWSSGVHALRDMAQACLGVSMLRLSDPTETESTLELSGKESVVKWAKRALNFMGFGAERSMLVFGITGNHSNFSRIKRQFIDISNKHGGSLIISQIGRLWSKSRFLSSYLRNTLWELGYAVDTLETALPWSAIEDCASALLAALANPLEKFGEKVLAFAHLSHVYPDGASVYVTYLYRRTDDPDETYERWKTMKHAASQVIIKYRGTISHQHGVGTDHADYLIYEKGQIGVDMMRAIQKSLDPDGLLNPGKLLL